MPSSAGSIRRLAIGPAATATLAMLLLALEPADAAKRKNGIVFDIVTSQGTAGRVAYSKNYEGKRNFAYLEVELDRTCVSPDGLSYAEGVTVVLSGRTRGDGATLKFVENTATDSFEQTANVSFRPTGRRKGMPRWKRATGTVRAYRAIHDAITSVECDSGPVSFRTTSSRRANLDDIDIGFVFVP